MKLRGVKRLAIPATFVATVIACSSSTTSNTGDGGVGDGGVGDGGISDSGSGGGATGNCDPVAVADASVRTFACEDGRTCGAPDVSMMDGGIYQVCPGPSASECATLVAYDGGSMLGFC